MSKGPGQTQQRIMDALTAAGCPLSVYELAEYVYGRRALLGPPASHRETIRRALRSLQHHGLVELGYGISAIEGDENYTTRRHLVAWPSNDES